MIHPFEILGKTQAFFVGPSLEKGPLPTLIYFALSAEDSLQCDPFNRPVQFLEGLPLRIFSITLPGHEIHWCNYDSICCLENEIAF